MRQNSAAKGTGPRRSRASQAAAGDTASPNAAFGERIRRLRQAQKLTLQQLAGSCDLAASTISKVENGQMSPTYENIVRFAKGLGVELAELFSDPLATPSGRRSITRAAGGTKLSTPHYEYEMLCTELTNRRFIPIHATIRAKDILEFPQLTRHEGEEFVYVLSGSIILHTEHYEPVRLEPGDSCYFASNMGHALVNGATHEAKVLWISSHVDAAALRAASHEQPSRPTGKVAKPRPRAG